MTAKFTDSQGFVRNVEVRVMPSQDGSIEYKLVQVNCLSRHVSNLAHVVVIVPIEDQANNEDEHLDAEEGTSEHIEETEDGQANFTDEEVSENEAMDIDRSKVEDGSKFEEEIEAILGK